MNNIYIILILISAFPIGYFLAYLTRDEILKRRNWLISLAIIAFILSVIFNFIKVDVVVKLTLIYISIVSLMCVFKSYDKKFVI